jgi:hypothetical protein
LENEFRPFVVEYNEDADIWEVLDSKDTSLYSSKNRADCEKEKIRLFTAYYLGLKTTLKK